MNTDRSTVHCALIPRRRPVCCDANGRLAKVPTRLCRLRAAIIAAVVEEPRSLPPPWSVAEQPACFVVQRQIPRPMPQLRIVSFTRRGEGHHRELASALQCREPAFESRVFDAERVCGSTDKRSARSCNPLRKEHMQEARDAVSS